MKTGTSLKDQLQNLLDTKGLQPKTMAQALAVAAATTASDNAPRAVKKLRMRVLRTTAVVNTPPVQSVEPPIVPDSTPDLPETPPLQLTPTVDSPVNVETALLSERLRKGLASLRTKEGNAERSERLARVRSRARKLSQRLTASLRRGPETREVLDASSWLVNAAISAFEAHGANDLDHAELQVVREQALAKLQGIEDWLMRPRGQQPVLSVKLQDLPPAYFNRYAKYRSRLPSEVQMERAKLRFKVLTLPILVIFSRPVEASDMEEIGFEVSDDGGYIVMLEQQVWAISGKMLENSDTWEGDEELYVERCLEQYKRRSGQPGMLLGPEGKQKIGHQSTKGISYYWVMPKREYLALPSPIKDWGFPF